MAGELQHTSTGALLFIESGANEGKLAHECCCEAPSCPCADDEPTLSASLAGTCAESPGTCDSFDGAYSFISFAETDYCCSFNYDRLGACYLVAILLYEKSTEKWFFRATCSSCGVDPCPGHFRGAETACNGTQENLLDVSAYITCSAGAITGTFDVAGDGDCVGCTLTATFT